MLCQISCYVTTVKEDFYFVKYHMAQNFDGGKIDKFDEFPAICQYFPYQNFPFR